MRSPVRDNFGDASAIYILTVASRSLKTLGTVAMSMNKGHDNSEQGHIVSGGRNLEWLYEGGEI